mgnify:CR=1 FL=1
MLSVLGILGLIIGIFALSGGFNEKVVQATSLYISEQTFTSVGNIVSAGSKVDGSGNVQEIHIVIEDDTTITLGSMPENSTTNLLTVDLRQDHKAISLPDIVKTRQPFTIKVLKDEQGRNIGGSAVVQFISQVGMSCKLNIIVDTPITTNSLKYNVSDLPKMETSYILTRDEERIIELSSDYFNSFNINQSKVSFLGPTVKRDVLFFTEQDNIMSTELVTDKRPKPFYKLFLNSKNVEGDRFSVITRMHRTYQMQEEFKEKGFLAFFDLYYGKPTSINNDASYQALVIEYNNYLNKYYNYINDTRSVAEFFSQFQTKGNEISLKWEKDSFLTQVWPSLKHVFIVADIEFFISDVEITGLNVDETEQEFTVFDNTQLSLQNLIDKFNIKTKLGDGEETEPDAATNLSLLGNLSISVFVDKGEEGQTGVTTHEHLQSVYQLSNIINANTEINISLETESRLRLNYEFLEINKLSSVFNFLPKIPSKEKPFQIYVLFSLSITKSNGETNVFYDFSKIYISHTSPNSVMYEGNDASNIVERKTGTNPWDMCVDNNGLVASNPDIFDGTIYVGTQNIIINTNKIINKSQMQSQYLIPRLFIEYNSNNGVRSEMQIYLNGQLKLLEEQLFNIIKVNDKIANFTSMNGVPINYGEDLLTGYEIPLTNLLDGRFSANIQAINSSNDKIKFFVVFVLTDADSNAIDREGNRLFNDNGDAINVDGEKIDEPVNYVVLYSTLIEGDSSIDSLSSLQFSSISLLEKINYFTEIELGETDSYPNSYLYEEKNKTTGEITVKQALSYSLFLRNNRTDGSIDLTFTKLRLLTNEEYEGLIYVSAYNITRIFNSNYGYQIYIELNSSEEKQINDDGIDVIGNIKRAFDSAIGKQGNDKLDFITDNDKVTLSLSSSQASVDATQIYDIKTSAIEPETPAVLKVKSGFDKIYKLLRHDNLTILVKSPEVSNIKKVNDDEFDGVKNIIMSGEFDQNGNYGDVIWQFFTVENNGIPNYSFYYGNGVYKTKLYIDSADTNMLHLYQNYINAIEVAKDKINFNEALININHSLAEIVNIVNNETKKYNAANNTSYPLVKIAFSDEENVVDASINNENYIRIYLDELISKASQIDFDEYEQQSDLTYNVDRLLSIIQNYGIIPSSTINRDDNELAYIIDVVKSAYNNTFQNFIDELISLYYESSLDNMFDFYSDEIRKSRVVSAVNYLLYKVPKYNNTILKVLTEVDSVFKFDFVEVEAKMKTIVETIYYETLPTHDNYYDKLVEFLTYINSKDVLEEEAQTINDIIAFINHHLGVGTITITKDTNVSKYFTAGKYNSQTSEVLLNDDGTLPFKLGDFGDFVINIDFVVSLFQQTNGTYSQKVEKRYAFYSQFEKINSFEIKNSPDGVVVNSASNPLVANGGTQLALFNYIYVNNVNFNYENHMYVEIPQAYRSLANFGMVDGQYVYVVCGSQQTTLYLNSVVNIDEHISIDITMPYIVSGTALKRIMYIQIKHNFKYTPAPTQQLIGSADENEVVYNREKLTENFIVKEFMVDDFYSNISDFVSYELELVNGGNDFVWMINNELYVKNIYKNLTVQISVSVYRNDNLLFKFLEPVTYTLQPFYKVQINSSRVAPHYFENETQYNNSNLLENLFTFSKFNAVTENYEPVTNTQEIRHILAFSINISNTIPVEFWENQVGGANIKEQFFIENEGEPVATDLYQLLNNNAEINSDGLLMLPELSKTVMLPVVAKFNGYFDGEYNGSDKSYSLYIFIKVGGIIKWQSDSGEIDAEYDESQNFSLPATDDGYKQTFHPINLSVGSGSTISYNLNEYFALLLGTDFSSEHKFLKLSFEITSESATGISMQLNQINLVGGNVAGFSNLLQLNEAEIVNDITSLTLRITAYEYVGMDADFNLEYKQVEYADNIVEITITKE